MKTWNPTGRAYARRDNFKSLNADYIKRTISPLDFYRHELPNAPLKKHGWIDGGLCVFHADNRPGSFRVNTQSGAFLCFSCGSKGSDIIAFTMALNGLSFRDALHKLAREWGIL
jgi:DNA primase